jgi:hypothetical protein
MKAIVLSKQGRHQESYRMYMTAMCGFAETRFSGALTLLVHTAMGAFSAKEVIDRHAVERFCGLASMVRGHQVCYLGKHAAEELENLLWAEVDRRKAAEMRRERLFLRLIGQRWRSYEGISRDIKGEIEQFDWSQNGS